MKNIIILLFSSLILLTACQKEEITAKKETPIVQTSPYDTLCGVYEYQSGGGAAVLRITKANELFKINDVSGISGLNTLLNVEFNNNVIIIPEQQIDNVLKLKANGIITNNIITINVDVYYINDNNNHLTSYPKTLIYKK